MFTIQYVKDLHWGNKENTFFSCLVKYEEFNEEHPTGVSPIDKYSHINELWKKAISGDYGTILEYVEPIAQIPEPAPQEEQPLTNGTQTL